jgi:hypothetical protein
MRMFAAEKRIFAVAMWMFAASMRTFADEKGGK